MDAAFERDLTLNEARMMAVGLGHALQNRDPLVRKFYAAGMSKQEIHERTGLARSTINRILTEGEQ